MNSCLSSIPTTKKKTARSPSDAQCPIGRERWADSRPTCFSEIAKYEPRHGEFDQTMAARAAIISTIPANASLFRA